jgi:hypothetical protein
MKIQSEIQEIKNHLEFLNEKIENLSKEIYTMKEMDWEEEINWENRFIVIHGNEETKCLTASFHPTEEHAIETLNNHELNKVYKSLKVINLKELIK